MVPDPRGVGAPLAWLALLTLAACTASATSDPPRPERGSGSESTMSKTYTKPSDDELRQKLTRLQYEVTQRAATEPPFRNEFWDNHARGLYVDVTTGEPLFSSDDTFESGTGWPSFTRPVDEAHVVTQVDRSHGMIRTEVLSRAGGAHLGHLFDDGPAPTHQRYCMNSAAMRFIPPETLDEEGSGAYRARFADAGAGAPVRAEANACAAPASGEQPGCSATIEEAILAGGCFWGMEEIIREIPGVIDTEVGYTGGTTEDPSYAAVSTGRTGHAESVKILFDPERLSFAELLEKWFFRMHDPTTRDRQGNDRGSQYRSAIFATSPAQEKVAREVIERVAASGKWKDPIVTEVVTAGKFTAAEDYHQDYLVKNPGGYTCHFLRD